MRVGLKVVSKRLTNMCGSGTAAGGQGEATQ